MIYPEKVKILAKKNQPKPEEARYWVDLTTDASVPGSDGTFG